MPPADPQTTTRRIGAIARLSRIRLIRAVGLSPVIALPGYWFATLVGLVWGAIAGRFHLSRQGGMIVAARMPTWAFGRGGTTIGAVYLTAGNITPAVLEHEAVHRAQWKRYGLAFVPLYIAAGRDWRYNRFEIAAGLKNGGYV